MQAGRAYKLKLEEIDLGYTVKRENTAQVAKNIYFESEI